VPPQSQSDVSARVGRISQDGDAQQQETGPLLIAQIYRLHEFYHVRGEDDSMTTIPSQHTSNLRLRSRVVLNSSTFTCDSIVVTVEDSVLRTEMTDIESQEKDTPRRVLYFKPMSWLGQIRPHRRDESWSASL
jgi:hypothetical protein